MKKRRAINDIEKYTFLLLINQFIMIPILITEFIKFESTNHDLIYFNLI